MKYERFEDLPVWKAAIELAKRIYVLTRNRFFSQPGDLRDQIRRASLSVSNHIAEGFERGSTSELLYFLYVARGSCGETRSMLRFLQTFEDTHPFKSEISYLRYLRFQNSDCSEQETMPSPRAEGPAEFG